MLSSQLKNRDALLKTGELSSLLSRRRDTLDVDVYTATSVPLLLERIRAVCCSETGAAPDSGFPTQLHLLAEDISLAADAKYELASCMHCAHLIVLVSLLCCACCRTGLNSPALVCFALFCV